MKTLLTFLLSFVFIFANANTYYFAINGSNSNNGTSSSTPWAISNLSSHTFVAGDIILLRRGDVFYGAVSTLGSGTSTNHISVDAYGTGDNPALVGYSSVTSWTSVGGGIYKSNAFTPQTDIKMVILDFKPAVKGRYPNADAANGGYLFYENYDNTAKTITDNQLSSTAIDATWGGIGAQLGIRTNNSYIDIATLTGVNVSTGVLTYTPVSTFSGQPSHTNYGYFVTNSLKTLDQYGEWYYNPSDKCVYMYFGNSNPDLHDVKATTTDIIFNSKGSYWSIRNVDFLGGNMYNIFGVNGGLTDFSLDKSIVRYCGNQAIEFNNRTNITIDSCTVMDAASNCISLGYRNENAKVSYSLIKNAGMIPSCYYRDMNYQGRVGIGVFTTDAIVTGITFNNNQVINTGFMGIFFNKDKNFIYKNYFNNNCSCLDDGGGIYTYGKPTAIQTDNKIRRNIVVNCQGTTYGTTTANRGEGIYLDDNSALCRVDSNFVVNSGEYGIFLHNADSCWVISNYFIDSKNAQIGVADDGSGDFVMTDSISDNVLFSKASSQKSIYLASSNGSTDKLPSQFGFIDRNRLCNPYNENGTICVINIGGVGQTNYSFTSWKSSTAFDHNGAQTPLPITNLNNILMVYVIDEDRTIQISGTYKNMFNVSSTNTMVVKDHTGVLLAR